MINFIRVSSLCVKHCDELFYTPLPRNIVTRLRAAFFPIYRVQYIRYLSEHVQSHG